MFSLCAVSETWAKPDGYRPPNFPVWSPFSATASPGKGIHGVGLWAHPDSRHQVDIISVAAHGRAVWLVLDKWLLLCIAYLPPSEDDDSAARWLVPPPSAPRLPILIVGDMNARLGALAGDHAENSRGRTIHSLLTSVLDLQRIPSVNPGKTFMRSNGDSSVVDHAYTSLDLSLVELKISPAPRGRSDHFFLTLRVDHRAIPSVAPPLADPVNQPRLRLSKLDHEHFHALVDSALVELQQEMDAYLTRDDYNPNSRQSLIDRFDLLITDCLLDIAKYSCGLACPFSPRGPKKPPEVINAMKACRRIGRRVGRCNAHLGFVDPVLLNQLEAAHAARIVATAEWRKAEFQKLRQSMQNGSQQEAQKFIARVVRRRRRAPPAVIPTQENLDCIADHFANASRPLHTRLSAATPPPIEESLETGIVVIDRRQVHSVLRRLAPNKAPGPSGLVNALVRSAPLEGNLIRCISHLFSLCRSWGLVPQSWCRAHVVPVPKKGSSSDISNHRPISLTETLRKVFERCLMYQLTDIADLDVAQGGFRPGRGTIDQVAALIEARIQRAHQLKRSLLTACLDIKAAYDTVDRSRLWAKLKDKGASAGLVRTLSALFDHNESRIFLGGRASKPYIHELGLLQGSILSPVLYAIFIDDLLRQLRQSATWSMGGVPTSVFAYADDLALVADDENHLACMLRICTAYAECHGFRFAPSKCVVIAPLGWESPECDLHGERLPRSSSFVYLGVDIDLIGIDSTRHAKRMRSKAVGTTAILCTAGMNAYGLGGVLGSDAFTTFVRPIIEYGLALWPLQTSPAMSILSSAQHQCLSMLMSVPRSTSRLALHHLTSVPPVRARGIELSARWLLRRSLLPEDGSFTLQCAQAHRETAGNRHRSCLRVRPEAVALAESALPCPPRDRKMIFVAFRSSILFHEWDACATLRSTMAREPGLTLRQIGLTSDRALEMVLLRVATRTLFGKPIICCKCRSALASWAHVTSCLFDFGQMLANGSLLACCLGVAHALQSCLGRPVFHLVEAANQAFGADPERLHEMMRRRRALLSPEQILAQTPNRAPVLLA
jgi:hypothetical protein